ncbi:hypothetical protein BpHYR1_026955, partial [Brachionus plicatilis]
MPVGLYVNNSGNEAAFKNVLSQIYTSSSPSSSLSPSCSSVSSSSSSDSRLDSRPVVFVVLTQNELNNLHTSKLNLHFVDPTTTINKENTNEQVSQIHDDQIKYLLDEHNLIEHHHHHHHHQQQEEHTATKNNIDYAIDAVLAKCRQESREPSVDSIPSVHSETTKIAKTKLCRNKAVDVESEQQSKSSKARTSYISSLIASRQKSVDDKQLVDIKTKSASSSLLS